MLGTVTDGVGSVFMDIIILVHVMWRCIEKNGRREGERDRCRVVNKADDRFQSAYLCACVIETSASEKHKGHFTTTRTKCVWNVVAGFFLPCD